MRHAYAIGFLVIINLLVFGQTVTFDFVEFDDKTYLIDNPQFEGGLTLENIKWSFTTGYFVNWHPVTWLTYFLDNELYGMDPRGYHATNVIIHILATLLLYFALFRMTAKPAESLIVAVLFAIHPQHVQSVAWISERKDVLSAFFMGLTLLAYHRYTQTGSLRFYGLTAIVFTLGLLSKSMLVTLPCVLLLLDHWPLKRLSNPTEIRRAVLEKIPLLALAVVSSVVTFIVQNAGGAASTIENFGFSARIANATTAYATYLWRTVYPANLTFFYPLVISKISYGWAAVSAAILILITITVWRFRKSAPAMLIGWLWYLGTLVPVIGLVQVGGQSTADRYTYIPLIGIFIGIVYTVHPWLQRTPTRKQLSRYAYCALLVGCLFISFKETYFWKDSQTLAGRSLVVRDDNHLAYQILGNLYMDTGDYQSAEQFYTRYYSINPANFDVQLRLATVLQEQGKFSEAESTLQKCMKLFPDLATPLFNMGILMVAQGKTDEAKSWYVKALELDDRKPTFYINYGNLLAQTGDLDLALAQYDAALEIDPENTSAYHNRASSLFFHHRPQEALQSVEKCLAIDPNYAAALPLLEAIEQELASIK